MRHVFEVAAKLFWSRINRQHHIVLNAEILNFFSNFNRVCQRFGMIGKQLKHLIIRLQILISGVHQIIVIVFVGVDPDKNFVCLEIFLFDVMNIVGGNKFHACLLRKTHQYFVHLFLFR
ncbi:hypothetical protein SDC9_70749 [bioreactor metagenome]|uniref:Uncharacterized protein n=1 Tax=bioreactor metagenome TaxID=1076179 RepID=A0A644Y8L6_9ZZZZ